MPLSCTSITECHYPITAKDLRKRASAKSAFSALAALSAESLTSVSLDSLGYITKVEYTSPQCSVTLPSYRQWVAVLPPSSSLYSRCWAAGPPPVSHHIVWRRLPVTRRVCTIEEVANGYVVRLYEPGNGSRPSEDIEWFIEPTLADVEQRIERYFLLPQATE